MMFVVSNMRKAWAYYRKGGRQKVSKILKSVDDVCL